MLFNSQTSDSDTDNAGENRRADKRFDPDIPEGETVTETFELPYHATIENVSVRFYPGPQLTLEVLPFRETPDGDRLPLVDVIGERDTLVGDDDSFTFDVSEPVRRGDTIGVMFENNGDHDYRAPVDIEIDRHGGIRRTVTSVMEVFR